MFETAASAIPPPRPEPIQRSRERPRNRCGGRGVEGGHVTVGHPVRPTSAIGPDARLAAPYDPRQEGRARRGGRPPVRGRRRPDPAPRPRAPRAGSRWQPRGVQQPRRVLPGPPVRARRAHGARPGPGIRRRPGGVLLRLPQHALVPRRERALVAEPHRDQRGDGPAAAQEAAAVPAVPGARGRELAAARGARGRPGPDGHARRAVARPGGRPRGDHAGPAVRDRPVRRRGLRLRRDRRADRRLAGHGEVAHPSRAARAA